MPFKQAQGAAFLQLLQTILLLRNVDHWGLLHEPPAVLFGGDEKRWPDFWWFLAWRQHVQLRNLLLEFWKFTLIDTVCMKPLFNRLLQQLFVPKVFTLVWSKVFFLRKLQHTSRPSTTCLFQEILSYFCFGVSGGYGNPKVWNGTFLTSTYLETSSNAGTLEGLDRKSKSYMYRGGILWRSCLLYQDVPKCQHIFCPFAK